MVADVPRQVSLRRFPGSNVLSYYVIIIFIYTYTYNRVTSTCIDLSKIKLFVFVFVFKGNSVDFTVRQVRRTKNVLFFSVFSFKHTFQ